MSVDLRVQLVERISERALPACDGVRDGFNGADRFLDRVAIIRCSIEVPGVERMRVMEGDVWGLADAGYLKGQRASQAISYFIITAEGFDLYEELRERPADPVAAVEDEMGRYLDSERFRTRFPAAYSKLRAASELLWQTSPADDLTNIGHTLRESVQRFATEMVERLQVDGVDPDPAHTKNRLQAVVEFRRDDLGERKTDLLDALVGYHDAVNGVIQRLEHADQKERDPATWDDARSAVFQTMNLLVEFDRLINAD